MKYERQLNMEEIGIKGQEQIANSRIAVIGAGGLGSPVLTYLTCMGVKKIRLIDNDVVSESNLNRQFLHWEKDIGRWKVESAKEKLEAQNQDICIEGIKERIEEGNVEKLLADIDIVIDCVDNIVTRLLVGRACLKLNIPLVEGGVKGFYGWVMSIDRTHACLDCMGFEALEMKEATPIIGVTAGVIGCLQANECLKIILGMSGILFGKMLQYDGKNGEFAEIEIEKTRTCKSHQSYENPSLSRGDKTDGH